MGRDYMMTFTTRIKYVALASISILMGGWIFAPVSADAAGKPAIEVITHAGAGGGTDVNSRMMMLRSRRTLKQDMVVVVQVIMQAFAKVLPKTLYFST